MYRPPPLRLAAALFLAVTLQLVICSLAEGPICGPRAQPPGTVEVVDHSQVATGVTMTSICTDLSEPRVQVTVHPTHYATFLDVYTYDEKFHFGYDCKGSVTVARNFTRTLPRGVNGKWTTAPVGYDNDDAHHLALGDSCIFFGCYEYTHRLFDENHNLHKTIYVVNFNSTSCVIDKDECSDGSAQCEHECDNFITGTSDSYQCTCRKGFSLSEDQHHCTDIDECVLGTASCDQICTVDDNAWYNCSCREGYIFNHDGHTCDDIDECRPNGRELCDTELTGRNCANTPGSYQCQCLEGFEFDEQQYVCKDIDECSMGTALCQHQCINIYGGYNCTCNRWYKVEGDYNCTVMDVCTLLAVDCGSHSQCLNAPEKEEGYRCRCQSGYEPYNDSCKRRGIVHVYWIVSLLIVIAILVLLGCVCLLRHKYNQNRHDPQKRYNILFKYQLKKEKVDPSYEPVELGPMRKIAYTFSLMSSLEIYEHPSHTKLLERNKEKYLDKCSASAHNNVVTTDVDDEHRRKLSAIVEHIAEDLSLEKSHKDLPISEDEQNSGKQANCTSHKEQPPSLEWSTIRPGLTSSQSYIKEGISTKGSMADDMHNTLGKHCQETKHSVSDGYIDGPPSPTHHSMFHTPTTPPQSEQVSDCCTDELCIETETENTIGSEKVSTDKVTAKHTQHGSCASLHGANMSTTSPQPASEVSAGFDTKLLIQPLFADATQPQMVSGGEDYTPSNSSTTSSGCVSGMTSHNSPSLSTSSQMADSSVGLSGFYVPSHLSTVSSGYSSGSCVSMSKRCSLLSNLSCDTFHIPQSSSGMANGDYVPDTSLCESPHAQTTSDSVVACNFPEVCICSEVHFGTPNDSVFNDEECTHHTSAGHQIHRYHKDSSSPPMTVKTTSGHVNDCNESTSSVTQISVHPQTTPKRHAHFSTGYIPYPGLKGKDPPSSNEDITFDLETYNTEDDEVECSIASIPQSSHNTTTTTAYNTNRCTAQYVDSYYTTDDSNEWNDDTLPPCAAVHCQTTHESCDSVLNSGGYIESSQLNLLLSHANIDTTKHS